jgi:hypothetical protein
MRRNFKIKLDLKSIGKYLVACIVIFAPLFVFTESYLEYNNSIIEFLPDLLVFVGLGVTGYLFLTYVIDFKTRILFNSIIQEMRNKLK